MTTCAVLRCPRPADAVLPLNRGARSVELAVCTEHHHAVTVELAPWQFDGEHLLLGADAQVETRRTLAAWDMNHRAHIAGEATLTLTDDNGFDESFVITYEQAHQLAEFLTRFP